MCKYSLSSAHSTKNRCLFRPKPTADCITFRRRQNHWESEVIQREVPRTSINERTRDRWGLSNDRQSPAIDSHRSSVASPRK